MPFYLRKSVKVGPLRFNLSKSGVGASVGTKGLRLGTGPRGHYVHAGTGGLYYRKSLNGKKETRSRSRAPEPTQVEEPAKLRLPDVGGMVDERFSDLLAEIEEKSGYWRRKWLYAAFGALVGWIALGLAFEVQEAAIAGAVTGFVLFSMLGARRDRVRGTVVCLYDLEGDAARQYEKLTEAFDVASGSERVMAVASRNASGSKKSLDLVGLVPARLEYALPRVLASNVTPPVIRADSLSLYFLPDVVLVHDGKSYGAIGYASLGVVRGTVRFVQDGEVPSDALVVDETWEHVNKDGSPDRRRKDNPRLPVCLYGSLSLRRGSEEFVSLRFSRKDVVDPMATVLRGMAAAIEDRSRSDRAITG